MSFSTTTNYLRKGMRTGGRIGAATGAVAGAALGGLPTHHTDMESGKKVKRTTSQRVLGGAVVAGGLGYAGRNLGANIGLLRNASKLRKGFRPRPKDMPEWLKGAKTRSEARKKFHAQSRKHHPDLGGTTEGQAKINSEWEAHEPFFKEAMLAAFADELKKIMSDQ